MAYTTIDKPSDYFKTILFTGNGSNGHAISGLDFQPDWVWLKNRNTGNTHEAFDSVRGATKTLYPDRADAEYVNTSGSLTSFNSDGFTVGSGDGANKSGSGSLVSWNWKAGTSFTNDASATGIGTIDSAGSVNTDAGFSICSWTGNATDNATVKHGLSQKPDMVIIKARENTSSWLTWHKDLTGAGYAVFLDATDAQANYNILKNQSSSVLTLSTNSAVNANNQGFISYNFHSVKGYSKFGSYTGNGNANGAFVYTGFRVSFVMCKRSDSGTGNWQMFDSKREGYNVDNDGLQANLSNAEATDDDLDILSNGFKLRGSGNDLNGSGSTYIYMAFAESPFVTSTGVPATAR